jgi:hypothetical protein
MAADVEGLFFDSKFNGDSFDVNKKLLAYRFINTLRLSNSPISADLLKFSES